MIPMKITLSGFMSYREKQTLNFDGARLWVLSGSNGAGKSAIFDAITFVLFGVYRGQKQNFTDLINHGSDRATVEYDFCLDNVVYRVRRTVPKRGAATRGAYYLIKSAVSDELKPEPIENTENEDGFKKWVEHKVGLNYETFTASVLLQQGKSDKLLDSSTDERYRILSKLIDLSRYEELEARAKEKKRYWDGRATYYTGQLANLPSVLDGDLVNAQQRISQAIEASEAAQSQVDELTRLYGHAQKWEALHGQLINEQAELATARQLISQEKEITQNYQRWVDLTRVLPILNGLLSSRARLDDAKNAEIRYNQEYENALNHLGSAEEREKNLQDEYDEQVKIATASQQEMINASNRQIELNPVIVLVDRIKDNRLQRENYLADLEEFPLDLQQQLTDALTYEARALEADKAVPWLHNLDENRKKLGEAVTKQDKVIKDLVQAQADFKDACDLQQKADSERNQAHQVEAKANSALTKAQAHLEEINERETRFGEVVGEKNCRYCGNEMTPEHVEHERIVIHSELTNAKEKVHIAEGKQKTAIDHRHNAESTYKKADELVAGLKSAIQAQDVAQNTALKDISRCLQSLVTAYSNLPSRFQNLVADILPGNETDWLGVIYPTLDDISLAQKDGGNVASQKANVERLRGLAAEHKKISSLLSEVDRTLERDTKDLPIGWETARSDYESGQIQKERADGEFKKAQVEQARIVGELSVAKRDADNLRKNMADAKSALTGNRAKQSEILMTLQNFEGQLTLEWQPMVASLTIKDLDNLQSEYSGLAPYEQLHQDLGISKQNVKAIDRKVVDLEKSITAIPEAARCKAEQVRLQLANSQAESQRAETEKHQSEQDNQMLIQRKLDRDAVETKKLNAERKTHLYGILGEQMGDQGIQQVLINKAEVEIVNEANQSLYNLSGGRWALSLRDRGRNKKALDMEVRDSMTGGRDAIPVVLASGSQRFRIAISLALAIGKYIRRESRRIESVIIDEGFGSLDKTGREDTIQELRSLQQHLERIILVSHQEEFYRTFQTGYTIEIVNGGSQVSLVNN